MENWDQLVAELASADERIRSAAASAIASGIRDGVVPCDALVDAYLSTDSARNPETDDRMRLAVSGRVAVTGDESDVNALALLCASVEASATSGMLFDPSKWVRVAAIRSMLAREDAASDMTTLLILLKELDEDVRLEVLRVVEKFPVFPELVIPQIIASMSSASHSLQAEMIKAVEVFGAEAVEPVISALTPTNGYDPTLCVYTVISRNPRMYTDALIRVMQSPRTREHVRDRVKAVLERIDDPENASKIKASLRAMSPDADVPRPVWRPPVNNKPKFAQPAVSRRDVYTVVLDADGIEDLSAQIDDGIIEGLLESASDYAQINALAVIRYRHSASARMESMIAVWMKSAHLGRARAANETFASIGKNLRERVSLMVDSALHTDSPAVASYYIKYIREDRRIVEAVFGLYYDNPQYYAKVVNALCSGSPAPGALEGVFAGLDDTRTSECVTTSLEVINSHLPHFDTVELRMRLVELAYTPAIGDRFRQIESHLCLSILKSMARTGGATGDVKFADALRKLAKDRRDSSTIRRSVNDILKIMGESVEDDEFDY